MNLIPEASSTWILPRLVGVSKALELFLTGRFFTGADAAEMGIVSKAVARDDVLAAAIELGREIATYAAPVAADDAFAASAGVTLSVAAPGVLANDADPDGDALSAVLVSQPAHGTLALGAGGGFSYTAAAGYSGADAFTYAPSDGALLGATATVTLTVVAPNQPPVAANDAFTAPYRKNTSYAPRVLAVLANDRDPDGSLAALRDPDLRVVTETWMSASRAVLERFVDPTTARGLDALIEGLVMHKSLSTSPLPREEILSIVHRALTGLSKN